MNIFRGNEKREIYVSKRLGEAVLNRITGVSAHSIEGEGQGECLANMETLLADGFWWWMLLGEERMTFL